jgi:basic membrane lipoprotein Med (substrate-binding protein (PBP1-ABC) superfamily)
MCVRLPWIVPLLLALACGGETGVPSDDAFRVALLTPGSIADGGWNAGAYAGLEAIRDLLDADVRHVETRTPAEFEEGFRDFAGHGFDLVFGHGFEYQEAAAKVAAEFPDTIFITTSGHTLRPNVAPMVFELEQAIYLCGVLAARMTQTGTLGLIGGIDLPSIRSTFIAFRGGALAARPEVVVRDVFIGNFDDTAAAREAARALLEEGADLLLHQANDAGRGVFRAVGAACSARCPSGRGKAVASSPSARTAIRMTWRQRSFWPRPSSTSPRPSSRSPGASGTGHSSPSRSVSA